MNMVFSHSYKLVTWFSPVFLKRAYSLLICISLGILEQRRNDAWDIKFMGFSQDPWNFLFFKKLYAFFLLFWWTRLTLPYLSSQTQYFLSNRKIWRMNTDYNVNVIMMQKLIVAKNAKWPNFQPFFKLMTKKRIQKHHFVYMMGLLLYRP